MKIEVLVKPGAKKNEVVKSADGIYRIKIKAPALEGKANDAVIEALAEHFRLPKQAVTILHGHFGRRKLILISE